MILGTDARIPLLKTKSPDRGLAQDASRLTRRRVPRLLRCLIILVLMRLRLSGDRYSTNTLPIRWSISCWIQTASRPSALEFERLAVQVQRLHLDGAGTLDAVIDARHRQAAFVVDLVSGLDQTISGLMSTAGWSWRFADIDHDQLFVNIDLAGGQADASARRTWFQPCRRPGCVMRYRMQ